MMIQLKSQDMGMLLFHMGIMRKEIKKALKRNYSFFEAKKQLACYDSIIELFGRVVDDAGEHHDIYIDLSYEQRVMLSSFLSSYMEIIKREAGREKIDASDILQTLEKLLVRLQEGQHVYAETV
ncbi:hypothetical protein [Geobacillus sp. TFV-3]|uniref:hypothetical protein n=1 Tax=Geobacillus sp. TFV-3 TaxID=1897059 RepID=UPI001359A1C1|nr:hypothetical protein [Geobacillus sp. TFV-3]